MRRLRAFGAFWYDFVIGDDWRIALGVALALGATAALVHAGGVNAWWLLPAATAVLLVLSLLHATRRGRH